MIGLPPSSRLPQPLSHYTSGVKALAVCKTLASSKPGYLRKVVAAGGFGNYEKAHRQALAKTFARVVFPRLPVDALSHVVAFAFHTGGY